MGNRKSLISPERSLWQGIDNHRYIRWESHRRGIENHRNSAKGNVPIMDRKSQNNCRVRKQKSLKNKEKCRFHYEIGTFSGCGGRIRTNDLRVMREDKSLVKNSENLGISTKSRIYFWRFLAWFYLLLSNFEAILPQIHPKICDRRVRNIIRCHPPRDLRVLERTGKPPLKIGTIEGNDLRVQNPTIVCHSSSP